MIKENKIKKKKVGLSLDRFTVLILDSLSKRTGKTKSRIAEEAILRYFAEVLISGTITIPRKENKKEKKWVKIKKIKVHG